MSSDKDELFCVPTDDGTAALATTEENKLAQQRSGPEKQVRTSSGVKTLTDNTKRFKLSSAGQAEDGQERPGKSQQKARRTAGPSVATTEEKQKKKIFGISFPKSKKEKCTPSDKMAPACTSTSHKGKPALTDKEDSVLCAKRTQTEDSKTSQSQQDNYNNSRGKWSTSIISFPVGSSVD